MSNAGIVTSQRSDSSIPINLPGSLFMRLDWVKYNDVCNNMFHGRKAPDDAPDQELVELVNRIPSAFLRNEAPPRRRARASGLVFDGAAFAETEFTIVSVEDPEGLRY